jgi:hypothetical protein
MTSEETIKMATDHADLAYDEKGRRYFTFDTIGLDQLTDEIEDKVREECAAMCEAYAARFENAGLYAAGSRIRLCANSIRDRKIIEN